MNKNLVVKILRKKTHHFLSISVIILVISLSMINFMLTYLNNQYQMINKDYLSNNNVKVIHVNAKAEDNTSTDITVSDEKTINSILEENGLSQKAKAYPIYMVPSIYDSSMETRFSILGVSQELSFLVSNHCTLENNSICVSKSNHEQMDIKIPLIEEKDGGYSSSQIIDAKYKVQSGANSQNAILIHSIPNNNQAYVNEQEALKLLKTMFQNTENSFDYIQQSHLDKVVVYVKDIKDIDTVGELLKDHQYYTSYTFNSFENFSTNISSMQVILIILSIIFIFTSIVTAVLLMINFLRIQKKEIAILKLNGYDTKSIIHIYTKLLSIMLIKIFIFSLLILFANYLFKLIPINFKNFLAIISIDVIILLVTLALVYIFGIKKVSKFKMLDLLKKDKEFD